MSREWIEIQNAYVLRYKQLEYIVEKCKNIATISTDARVNALIEEASKDMKSLKNVMSIYENHYEASHLLRNDHVLGFKAKWKAVVLHHECLYERLKCGESAFLLTFAPKIRVEDKVLEYADPQYFEAHPLLIPLYYKSFVAAVDYAVANYGKDVIVDRSLPNGDLLL